MTVSPMPVSPEAQQTAAEDTMRTYTLYYTTALGTIESATVLAEAWDLIGPYLVFWRGDRLVTALPNTSVLQFGDLEEANRSFLPDNPDDEGSHLVFADEPHDPWAALTGKE